MTLRTKTLTAALALTLSAGGYALAQEATTTTVPMTQPDAAPAAPSDGTTFVAAPADAAAPSGGADAVTVDAAGADTTSADAPAAQPEPDADPAAEASAAPDAGTPAASMGSEGSDHADDAEHAPGGHGEAHVEDIAFSFEGPFGHFDQFQLQRGLQVYTEVCSACHGMKFVPIRTLAAENGPGLPEDQVRAYAADMQPIADAETGENRPRLPTDHFPKITGLGMGPDLSLMAKARAGFHGPYGTGISQFVNGIGGPEYIHALLTGYTGEEQEQAGTVLYENTAFPSGYIGMPPPLEDDQVTYADGTPATVDQMSQDIAAFLMWTAEPKLMDRKKVGFAAVLLLAVFTALLYLTNKRLWSTHKGPKKKH